ncbi:hypothetical protein D9M72_574610 [compost metagenome]
MAKRSFRWPRPASVGQQHFPNAWLNWTGRWSWHRREQQLHTERARGSAYSITDRPGSWQIDPCRSNPKRLTMDGAHCKNRRPCVSCRRAWRGAWRKSLTDEGRMSIGLPAWQNQQKLKKFPSTKSPRSLAVLQGTLERQTISVKG